MASIHSQVTISIKIVAAGVLPNGQKYVRGSAVFCFCNLTNSSGFILVCLQFRLRIAIWNWHSVVNHQLAPWSNSSNILFCKYGNMSRFLPNLCLPKKYELKMKVHKCICMNEKAVRKMLMKLTPVQEYYCLQRVLAYTH